MFNSHRLDCVDYGFLGVAGASFVALVVSVAWLLAG